MGSVISKISKGYIEVSRWYLVGISLISIFIAALKVYLSFTDSIVVPNDSSPVVVAPPGTSQVGPK